MAGSPRNRPSGPESAPRKVFEALEEAARSLNSIAALLARVEPNDSDHLNEAASGLRELVQGPYCWASLRGTLSVAADRIEGIAGGKSLKADADMQEAYRLLDRASEMLQERSIAERCAEEGSTSGVEPPSTEPGPREIPLPAEPGEAAEVPAPAEPTNVPAPAVTGGVEEGNWSLPGDADVTLLGDFVLECREYLEGAEAALLELETDPEQLEAINTVFRAFHTIKGTSGFLGITTISTLAHKAENLLSRARDKEIRCTGGYADLALRSVDAMKVLIDGVQHALSGGVMTKPGDYDDLIRILIDPEAAGVTEVSNDGPASLARLESCSRVPMQSDMGMGDPPAAPRMSAIPEAGPARETAGAAAEVVKAVREQKAAVRKTDDAGDSSTRVRTDRLDRLIDMVGELVIAHSMVAQDEGVSTGQKPELLRKVSHAGKIVRELQDLSMSMRMVPLKPTFLKMTRLVRDLAHKGGRQVEFVTAGEETEIDRNMVDVLADPLVHMIRNAVDHGIETPEIRTAAGKPTSGRVRLSAFHAGGNVVVELQDDGKGLDREKILRKAVERGLVEADKGMSDREVYNLIFEPGFSTAEKVTEVSGRGVGMDVVRRAIASLRGRIEIQSEIGVGTTFTVKLPLTLAVTDGMLVRVGGQRFIMPTVSIHISFRPEASAITTVTGRAEMVSLRGNMVPIVRLHRIFGIEGAVEDPTGALLVVVDDGNRRSALMVDELLGQQQVVAKSLGEGVGRIPGVAGGAILGDGRVGLILDPAGVAQLSRDGGAASLAAARLERLAA